MMAQSLTGDDKFREESSGDYRFARTHVKRDNRMRSALRRTNGCLKTMIEAIADSKVRRMRRDLALRGIHFDPYGNNWVVRNAGPGEHSR
jgi:hypothetical protein